MRDLPRFIKLGDERINVDEIATYGSALDEDGDLYLYIETKSGDDIYQYYADELECDVEDKLADMDELFLLK